MTAPSPEVAPYALMLEVVGPLPRPWRMAAVRLMRDVMRAQAAIDPFADGPAPTDIELAAHMQANTDWTEGEL